MRLGVIATIGRDWKAAVERVRIAEDLGDEHVTTGEAWGPSAIPKQPEHQRPATPTVAFVTRNGIPPVACPQLYTVMRNGAG